MRNLELIDAVVALHEIARTIEHEIGEGQLSSDVRSCANRLHTLSIADNKNSTITTNIINRAKQ